VDQHDVSTALYRDRLQAGPDRTAPAVRAGDEMGGAIAEHGLGAVFLAFAQHNVDGRHAAMCRQGIMGVRQHGLAADPPILFGNVATGPASLPGGDDQRDDPAVRCHAAAHRRSAPCSPTSKA